MENNKQSDPHFRVDVGKVRPGGDIPHGFDEIAQHASEGAVTRVFLDGKIPEKGLGRYSLQNAAARAIFFQQRDIYDANQAKANNQRRQKNSNAYRPYGR